MGQYRSPPTSPCSHRPSLSTINEEPFGPLVTPPDRSSSFESTSSDGCGDYATVPLLLSYDEKSGLPYSSLRHRRRKERLYKEDGSDGPSAAWRIVKALAFLALSACISSFFFLGTLYIPFLAGETSSEFQSADDWIYAPLLVRESTNASVLDRPKGYNPLAPSEKLEYGTLASEVTAPSLADPRRFADFNLHIEFVRSTISTGETSSIIFHCRHNDISLCPSFYRVLLAGPTIHSPPHAKTTVLDDRRVQVEMGAVRDPGWYQLYTWPEYERCERFEKEDAEKPCAFSCFPRMRRRRSSAAPRRPQARRQQHTHDDSSYRSRTSRRLPSLPASRRLDPWSLDLEGLRRRRPPLAELALLQLDRKSRAFRSWPIASSASPDSRRSLAPRATRPTPPPSTSGRPTTASRSTAR